MAVQGGWENKFFIRPYSSLESINALFGKLSHMHEGWKLSSTTTFTIYHLQHLPCPFFLLLQPQQGAAGLHGRDSLLTLEAVTFHQPLLDVS